MEFSPANHVVKLCLQGTGLEESGNTGDAGKLFLKSWNEATDNFEKFLAAYFLALHQQEPSGKVNWFLQSVQYASQLNDSNIQSVFPSLYLNLAHAYTNLNDRINAQKYFELVDLSQFPPTDNGPFYHGTRADLKPGDLLIAGGLSNYQSGLQMNHIYFTALVSGAGLAAELAKGSGEPRVYIVEPTGSFENDPNVTDKKFPGNLTRSYRSKTSLRITGETTGWTRLAPEALRDWQDRLAKNKGEIIN